jgi:hypothetical protein
VTYVTEKLVVRIFPIAIAVALLLWVPYPRAWGRAVINTLWLALMTGCAWWGSWSTAICFGYLNAKPRIFLQSVLLTSFSLMAIAGVIGMTFNEWGLTENSSSLLGLGLAIACELVLGFSMAEAYTGVSAFAFVFVSLGILLTAIAYSIWSYRQNDWSGIYFAGLCSVHFIILTIRLWPRSQQSIQQAPSTLFRGADLTGAIFRGSQLDNCDFLGAKVDNVDWQDATGAAKWS